MNKQSKKFGQKPRICILKTDGINCEQETWYATALAQSGGDPYIVHVNQLRSRKQLLREFQVLIVPGGFSYGDMPISGRALAVELLSVLRDQLEQFVADGKLVLGICNGFQVLVRTGLLPFCELSSMEVTLERNQSGHFQCQWVELVGQPSPCVFTKGLNGRVITLPIAHGEGQFRTRVSTLTMLEQYNLIPLRYLANPNGSTNDIAGICNPSGRIFGLMPHPERYVKSSQYVNWRRTFHTEPHGLGIFTNGIAYAAKNLC